MTVRHQSLSYLYASLSASSILDSFVKAQHYTAMASDIATC